MRKKIYIITHKDDSYIPKSFDKGIYELLNIKRLYPIYNRIFCEYCGMHHIWNNHIYSDYVGFCHYKRYIFEYNLIDDFNNDSEYQIFYKQYLEISHIKHLKIMNIPDFAINDLVNFLDKYNLKDALYEAPHIFYNRMIYYASWKAFDNIMIFLNDYVKFIENKYDINNEQDWKDHIIENVIMYYRNNYDNIINEYIDESNSQILFQNIKCFNNIFNDDYGFNDWCNCWRVYAYIIEILVNIYISNHNVVYKDVINKYSVYSV